MEPHWLLLFEEDLAKPINLPHLFRALLLFPFVSVWELFHLLLFPLSNAVLHTPKNKSRDGDNVTG